MAVNRTEYKGKVIGMVLGDGYLSQARKNALLKIKHCDAQKEYFDHKVRILEELTSVNVRSEFSPLNGKEYKHHVCETKSHPLYTSLRDHFYYHGRKTIDSHLMKLLSIEGLAYWYADDGSWWGDEIKQAPVFCTDCFNKAEQELMAYWLNKRFGLKCTVRKCRKSYRVYMRMESVDKFTDLIKPFLPNSMLYKLKYDKIMPSAKTVKCLYCGEDFFVRDRDSEKRKYCSHSCQQKYLYKMGLSSIQNPIKGVQARLRRYDLNSMVT